VLYLDTKMAEATATVVNEAALAMPLEQAAGSAASATSVTTPPAPAAPADDGVFSSIKRAFTGDPNKPPPRAVDVEAELKAKLDALPKTHISIKASARNLDKMVSFSQRTHPLESKFTLPRHLRTSSRAPRTHFFESQSSTPKQNSPL
jgi:hypothetical protein